MPPCCVAIWTQLRCSNWPVDQRQPGDLNDRTWHPRQSVYPELLQIAPINYQFVNKNGVAIQQEHHIQIQTDLMTLCPSRIMTAS